MKRNELFEIACRRQTVVKWVKSVTRNRGRPTKRTLNYSYCLLITECSSASEEQKLSTASCLVASAVAELPSGVGEDAATSASVARSSAHASDHAHRGAAISGHWPLLLTS